MVMADIVYFDLETQRTANDAGGWDRPYVEHPYRALPLVDYS